jgi:hypothetical protein
LGNTSETAGRLLDCVLRGETWPHAWLDELIDQDSPALFSVLAEGLSDRFEPRLVEAYTEIFAVPGAWRASRALCSFSRE